MSNRRKGGKYKIEVISDSKYIIDKLTDEFVEILDDFPETTVDDNYDSSSFSRTMKINFKDDRGE